MKVLLVEDSRSHQMLVSLYIKDLSHQVTAVNNGIEIVEAFIK